MCLAVVERGALDQLLIVESETYNFNRGMRMIKA